MSRYEYNNYNIIKRLKIISHFEINEATKSAITNSQENLIYKF